MVDGRTIIRAISHHRGNGSRDLVEQRSDHRAIADLVGGQLRGEDLVAVGINRQMKFAPGPASTLAVLFPLPLARSIDLQSRRIEDYVNRFAAPRQACGKRQTDTPPGKRGVVRNRQAHPEQDGGRAQQAFGLPPRSTKRQTP